MSQISNTFAVSSKPELYTSGVLFANDENDGRGSDRAVINGWPRLQTSCA